MEWKYESIDYPLGHVQVAWHWKLLREPNHMPLVCESRMFSRSNFEHLFSLGNLEGILYN